MSGKRILIVSKFLYPRGGDCIVALSEAQLLRGAGYEVEMWGMDYPDNLTMPLEETFAPGVNFGGGIGAKFKAFRRMMGFGDIGSSFASVLGRFRPDVVHFHNIHSYLSPVIVKIAKKFGARTLWTMHDYKLVCPAYTCLDSNGRICTDCFRKYSAVISKRCMKGSFVQSVAAYAEARRWHLEELCRWTDVFICPGEFMASKLREAGFPESKMATVLHFVEPVKEALLSGFNPVNARVKRRILYVGRLSPEKGLEPMLREIMSMHGDFTLRIFGTGPVESHLRQICSGDKRVEFAGWVESDKIARELVTAEVFICPSVCYENNTTGVMEALTAGTPVLVSDVGSLPDMVSAGAGMTYNPNQPGALTSALKAMFDWKFDYEAIRRDALRRFSPSVHLSRLESLF